MCETKTELKKRNKLYLKLWLDFLTFFSIYRTKREKTSKCIDLNNNQTILCHCHL